MQKYGTIDNLYKYKEILNYPVVVQEKIHGSNHRISFSTENGLEIGGRTRVFHSGDKSKLELDSFNFCSFAFECLDLYKLKEYPDYVFFGEFAGPGINKGVDYGPFRLFKVFDIRGPDTAFLSWDKVKKICKRLNLATVPILFEGSTTADSIKKLSNIQSRVGLERGIKNHSNIAEGVVIKLIGGQDLNSKKPYRVKYKSEVFLERGHSKTIKNKKKYSLEEKIEKERLLSLAFSFSNKWVTYGRLLNLMEHIKRNISEEIEMKHAPLLVKELRIDLAKDAKEDLINFSEKEIKESLKISCNEVIKLFKKEIFKI